MNSVAPRYDALLHVELLREYDHAIGRRPAQKLADSEALRVTGKGVNELLLFWRLGFAPYYNRIFATAL